MHQSSPTLQHGRVKVRTTEEQQELKRKQRAEKLAKFLQIKKLLFGKVGVCRPTWLMYTRDKQVMLVWRLLR